MTSVEIGRSETTLRQLDLLVNRKLDGLLNGDYQGYVRGPGSEAGDARMYQPGDDARRIDWSLTARTNATHVRDTIADRELETWLVVDGTASLDFGPRGARSVTSRSRQSAAFGFLTARAGNRVAAVCFDGAGTEVRPPRSGRDAVLALLHHIQQRPRANEGNGSLADALQRTQRIAQRRRGLVVVVSDLLDGSDWPRREPTGSRARHEVVVAPDLRSPRGGAAPVGLLTVVDPETGRLQEVQTNSRKLRERFAAAAGRTT